MAALRSRRSSRSSTRVRSCASSALTRFKDGFWRTVRLIAVDIFSVLHLMDEDQVVFQREEDAIIADAQAVFARLPGQLLHVALQAMLKRIEPLADPTPLLLW